MDTVQTSCIIALSFQYMILHFTKSDVTDHVFLYVPERLCLLDDADIASDCIERLWYVQSCQDVLLIILLLRVVRWLC